MKIYYEVGETRCCAEAPENIVPEIPQGAQIITEAEFQVFVDLIHDGHDLVGDTGL